MDKWTKRRRTVFFIALGIFIAMVIGIPLAISMQEIEDPVKHADVENIISHDTLTTDSVIKEVK